MSKMIEGDDWDLLRGLVENGGGDPVASSLAWPRLISTYGQAEVDESVREVRQHIEEGS